MIINPSNPSSEEIFNWAYSDEEAPHQEWGLFLIWKADFESYLRFAADINCPKENFFLDLLYYWVWRCIKHNSIENNLADYHAIFDVAKKINTPYIKIWMDRSQKLMANNQAFTQDQWYADRRPYDE